MLNMDDSDASDNELFLTDDELAEIEKDLIAAIRQADIRPVTG